MIEAFIVRISEIILSATAIFGIAIIFFATWYDIRTINQNKFGQKNRTSVFQESPPDIPKNIQALTHHYAHLNKAIFKKAVPSHFRRNFDERHINVIKIISFTASLVAVLLVTYYFYTAATLQSSTLLTLSWLLVSLWLVAIIWSNENTTRIGKIDLTLAIPFMYFIFYIKLLLYILTTIWKLATNPSSPSAHYHNFLAAIEREAYSTRY